MWDLKSNIYPNPVTQGKQGKKNYPFWTNTPVPPRIQLTPSRQRKRFWGRRVKLFKWFASIQDPQQSTVVVARSGYLEDLLGLGGDVEAGRALDPNPLHKDEGRGSKSEGVASPPVHPFVYPESLGRYPMSEWRVVAASQTCWDWRVAM